MWFNAFCLTGGIVAGWQLRKHYVKRLWRLEAKLMRRLRGE